MKFKIDRASCILNEPQPSKKSYQEDGEWYITIETLEQLLELYDEVGRQCSGLILYERNEITIYDDYIE